MSEQVETNVQSEDILRHEKYYLDDQLIVFLVEKRLFRVHRHFLVRESDVFRTMFSCPSSPEGEEGVDDNKPIHLPGVTRGQFEALLDYIYEGLETISAHKTRMIDLLAISTFYDMTRIRNHAIDSIKSKLRLSPIDEVCYAITYDIAPWLEPAYKQICARPDPLDIHEASRLGLDITVLIAKAREAVAKGRNLWATVNETPTPTTRPVDRPLYEQEKMFIERVITTLDDYNNNYHHYCTALM